MWNWSVPKVHRSSKEWNRVCATMHSRSQPDATEQQRQLLAHLRGQRKQKSDGSQYRTCTGVERVKFYQQIAHANRESAL